MIEQQRHHSDHTREQREGHIDRTAAKEDRLAVRRHPPQIPEAERHQHRRLDKHAGNNVDAHSFADQPVEAEGYGEDNGDPWNAADAGCLDRHAGSNNGDGDPAPSVQPFTKKQDPEDHGKQGIDEIAKRRLDHLARLDSMNKYHPVDGQNRAGSEKPPTEARHTQGIPHSRHSARQFWQQQHQKKQDCARPQRPMHHNFGGIDIADQADIDGNKPP